MFYFPMVTIVMIIMQYSVINMVYNIFTKLSWVPFDMGPINSLNVKNPSLKQRINVLSVFKSSVYVLFIFNDKELHGENIYQQTQFDELRTCHHGKVISIVVLHRNFLYLNHKCSVILYAVQVHYYWLDKLHSPEKISSGWIIRNKHLLEGS